MRPGEIVSLGDRIAWANVVPRGDDLDAVFYTTVPIKDEDLQYIKEKKSGILLCLFARLALHRDLDKLLRMKKKPYDIILKKVVMYVSHDVELYEMQVSKWRRLLSYLRPIKIYRYCYSAKDNTITVHVISFRGMNLKPKVVKEVKIDD